MGEGSRVSEGGRVSGVGRVSGGMVVGREGKLRESK